MADRNSFRLSATLLFGGSLFALIVGLFHAGTGSPNDYVAEFTAYGQSDIWTAVHLGQFVGLAVVLAGLLVLFFALSVHTGVSGWANRFGAVSAVVAIALYGVLQAVDGVALKQAIDAWMNAPEAEKVARLASAESIRWLEWGVRSYQSFIMGLAFILFAVVIVQTARIPKLIGYLMGLSGLDYIVQGWILGSTGFSPNLTIPQLLGYFLVLLWSIWFFIVAWRMKESVQAASV